MADDWEREDLVVEDGVECFEIRVVRSITPEGEFVTKSVIDYPDDGTEPSLSEVLGVVDEAVLDIISIYRT